MARYNKAVFANSLLKEMFADSQQVTEESIEQFSVILT